MANRWENSENSERLYFLGLQEITADGDCGHEIKRCLLLGFSSSKVQMWQLDYKESWAPKNWSFGTMVLDKTLKSPLDHKEIQLVHPKGNQY